MIKILFVILLAPFFYSTVSAQVLCRRDADITPVHPVFINKDPCIGSVKLQGISYKCGTVDEAKDLPDQFLSELSINATDYCMKFCRKRAIGCRGRFAKLKRCGFTVPPNRALALGEVAKCGDHCEGKALSYCSIYHSSYLQVDETLFKDHIPNCFCERAQ